MGVMDGWSTGWRQQVRTVFLIYFSIGLACSLWYTFHMGLNVAGYLVWLPVGWVTIVGWLVAWPVILILMAWFAVR